jgi:3-methylcrotonyl-CoA carboxylase alpha subunit
VIESLLVANRGEIACRIFRTARRLGVRTIAVFSEADAGAKHVREADEAVCIGAAAPKESYLNIGRLLAAAQSTCAQAIHPGYGFLSEKAAFARACGEAGRVFVGPPAAAIEAMGSKIVAKARMRGVGVPVLPGYDGTLQDLPHLAQEARKLGLPLMIKPAAGGGGKGMRIVTAEADIESALAGARRLAEGSFGDGTLLLERFLSAPRHVEVQVFADTHGHTLHLGDRDCSIQRRHQKLIEEAPAPALPDDLRERLRAAAVRVASEIGYVGAGTVEFLFDGTGFYFMEMNTRLQVEHTVTEAITGLDLVEWQLRVASGEPLPLTQDEVKLQGHAMEARVCAEDPDREFLPSAGRLRLLDWPSSQQAIGAAVGGVRVDAGFVSGDEVPATYDSLLGKVIAWGASRSEAASKLAAALDDTYAVGVHTNERWLARILRDSRFRGVEHSVAFLEQRAADLMGPSEPDPLALILAALALVSCKPGQPVTVASPWDTADGFTPNLLSPVELTFSQGTRRYEVGIQFERGTVRSAWTRAHEPGLAAGKRAVAGIGPTDGAELANVRCDDSFIAAQIGTLRIKGRYFIEDDRVHVWVGARHDELLVDDPRSRSYAAAAELGGLTTPLPGVVVSILVSVGQSVAAGDALLIVEAMKMEHTIRSPRAGTVLALHCAPGDRVPEGQALLELSA